MRPTPSPLPSRATLLALAGVSVATLAVPGTSAAQNGPSGDLLADPAGHPFRSPAFSPLEPVHRLSVVHVSRDGREGTTAFADLGDRLAFWIRRASGSEGTFRLAGQVAAGAFSRFDLDEADNEFLEIHYRVGVALRAGAGRFAARAELYHASSHLGDEFLTRTGREPTSTSREAIELLLQAQPWRGVMFYGGPGWILRSTLPLERASGRAGFELTPAPRGGGVYAGGEVFVWEELDGAQLSLEAGWAFSSRARLGATLGGGPSRAEQFFREDETLWGVSFSFRR